MKSLKIVLCVLVMTLVLVSCGKSDEAVTSGKISKETVKNEFTEEVKNEDTKNEESVTENVPSDEPENKIPSLEARAYDCHDAFYSIPYIDADGCYTDYKITFGEWNDSYEAVKLSVKYCIDGCDEGTLVNAALNGNGGMFSVEPIGDLEGAAYPTKVYKWSLPEALLGEYPDGEDDPRIADSFRGTIYNITLGEDLYAVLYIVPCKDTPATDGEREQMNALVRGVTVEKLEGENAGVPADCNHSYRKVYEVPATCSKEGVVRYVCELCYNLGGYTETLPKAPHTSTAATCTSAAVCTVCGVETSPATGHDFSPATTEAPKTCKLCGHTEGEALPKITINTSTAIGTYEHQGYTPGNTEPLYSYRIDGVRYEVGTQQADGKYPVSLYFTGEWLFDKRPDRVSPGNHNKHINELLWYQLYRDGLCSMSKSILIEEYKHSQNFEAVLVVYLYSGEYELRANPGIFMCQDPLYGGIDFGNR